ncbi:MAG: hypothetical protein JW726_10490 [Anaerolineales bacterium]|nr:hypothetical protein [Anaerolineales bacterium]
MWHKIDLLIALIQQHLARRPAMAPRDVYKLLYQGVRGPEHIITSPQAFTERLQTEWDSLDAGPDDPLLESIHPDHTLLRLNLRPFKAIHGDLQALTAACLQTGQRPWGTQAELQQAWEHCLSACRQNHFPGLQLGDMLTFAAWLQANDYPPVHHSEGYRALYLPAYRLVAADIGV